MVMDGRYIPMTRTKKLALALVVVVVSLTLLTIFFTEYSPLRNGSGAVSIEDKYGLALNLPEGWFIDDCSSESKRYINGFKYVCRWSSLPNQESGVGTSFALFVSEESGKPLSDDVIEFARERQEYGWAAKTARDQDISVSFDNTIESISYNKFEGFQISDYVEYKESGMWYLWTSTFVPIETSKANIILEINHLDEEVFLGEVSYTVEDILQNIIILNKSE